MQAINKAIGAEPVFVTECKAIVKQFLPTLMNLIDTETERGACRRISMCKGDGVSSARKLLLKQCAPDRSCCHHMRAMWYLGNASRFGANVM